MPEWYYAKGESEKVGPLTIEQLARAFLNGEINAATYVQKEGMVKWRRFDRLSAFEKLNAMRAEMAQKKLSESFLKETSPDASTSYVAEKKAISIKPAIQKTIIKKTPETGEAENEEKLHLSLAAEASARFSYIPYFLREAISMGLSLARHAIVIAAYGSLILILCAEINNYAKLKITFLDSVHATVSGVLKGRGAQTAFGPTCDGSSAEKREMALESLHEKLRLLEELGDFAGADKERSKIAQMEAAMSDCAK